MKHAILTIAALGLGAACTQQSPDPSGANTFVTPGGATIKYTSPTEPFSVLPRAGAATKDYWCAASLGATRIASATARLYLVSPVQPGQPATFSLTEPPGGGAPTGLATLGGDPNSMSVSSAKQLCPQGRDS